ncbi:5df37298-2bfe-49a6-9f7d-5546d10fd363-CDS [Sclerotinia trifoliorum]|uniref:5df37298-2bfe-49a6-9f7d-5546d10fd363-CDS n=1 Tax=Sclerotinia trifoliorum TaxID=28548 RepID=A0A8H2ZY50_9HELO|nr:5df37298-2bfe-49a6-9f7d-5546d10fd363-CDS [Sclerotinia trifoliorum]
MSSNSYDSNRITITILGDGGVGKSALTLRLVKSQWTSDYDPTIEDSYTLTRRIDGQTYHLSITDTAGQEEYRGMWQSANGSMRSDAFLLVYDITRRESLDALEWFDELISMEGEVRGEEWRRAQVESSHSRSRSKSKKFQNSNVNPMSGYGYGYIPPIKIVAGNKCDLQQSREVTASQGLEWARARNCGFMETSARSIVNIEETFALIVRRVVEGRRRAEMDREFMDRREFGDDTTYGISVDGEEGDELDRQRKELGTRRAMTKPLTPLPPGSLDGENEKRRDKKWRFMKKGKWGAIGRRLSCWK